jgi:subtilisin family serine protease
VANAEIGYVLQDALLLAANELSPGDVILIEQQHDLQYPFGVYVPVEYFEAYWDTIRTVTNAGIIVIEAAGNGNNDLDALGPIEDSGAIIVGAGEAPTGDGFSCTVGAPRSRAPFSNYGSRVDVQGWGECVVTTGYGDLHLGSGTDSAYTAMFSGTSSASPIVAGAAAILSSVIEANTGNAATPAAIRTLLKSTGTPQDFSAGGPVGNIGPLPNVAVALQQLGYVDARPLVARPVQTLATGMPIADGDAVPVDLSWSATDSDGVTGYKLKRRINGGRWKLVTLPSAAATSIVQNLPRGNTYQYAVAAQDATGLWSDWRIGRRFKVALRSEEHASISYTGGWKRVASSSAVGGYVKVSGTRDAYSTIAFSGSSIAWVATMASNRGEALVWVDQVLLGAYDLHSSTNTPRTVIVARDLPSGSHTMTVWVVGTDGRPKIDVDAFVILK